MNKKYLMLVFLLHISLSSSGKAQELAELSADKGALHYCRGVELLCEDKDDEAFNCFFEAQQLGSMEAIHQLASMYEYGKGSPNGNPDIDQAIFYYQKIAELDPDAANTLGAIYEYKKNNVSLALRYYSIGAESCELAAQNQRRLLAELKPLSETKSIFELPGNVNSTPLDESIAVLHTLPETKGLTADQIITTINVFLLYHRDIKNGFDEKISFD